METRGFPLCNLTLAGSRPGGRPTFLRRQESRQRRRPRCCAARRLRRGFSESPRVVGRAWVIDAKAKRPVDALMTQGASGKAGCVLKAPSEPLSSAATGGEVRRSCLSPRSGRVLRRPPDASSAGESLDQATLEPRTGEAGVASLPTFLATQESRAPAGARPGQRSVKNRKAVGPHQRTAKHPASLARIRPEDVGLRCANPTYGTGPHQRAASCEWWRAPWRAKG